MALGGIEVVKDIYSALKRRDKVRVDFDLSDDLYNMFLKAADYWTIPPDRRSNRPYIVFNDARRVYTGVMDSHPSEAVFYRLEDLEFFRQTYEHARSDISKAFVNYVIYLGSPPNADQVNQFFLGSYNMFNNEMILNPHDHIPMARLNVIQHLIGTDPSALLTDDIATIKDWFDNHENSVLDLATRDFYGVPNVNAAYNNGVIYSPVDHNWGVNTAWALAVTQKRLTIRLLSDFTPHTQVRRRPTTGIFPPHPSAYALEIAIALKMGYSLDFEGGYHPKLIPPNAPVDLAALPNSNVIIPGKQEQMDYFDACILAKYLHNEPDNDNIFKIVHQYCISPDPQVRLKLILALDFTYNKTPILGRLPLAELAYIKAMWGVAPLDDPQSFLKLRAVVDYALRQHIHSLITSDNFEFHQQLAQSLAKTYPLAPVILSALTLREYNALLGILLLPIFNVPQYKDAQNNLIIHLWKYIDAINHGTSLEQYQALDFLDSLAKANQVKPLLYRFPLSILINFYHMATNHSLLFPDAKSAIQLQVINFIEAAIKKYDLIKKISVIKDMSQLHLYLLEPLCNSLSSQTKQELAALVNGNLAFAEARYNDIKGVLAPHIQQLPILNQYKAQQTNQTAPQNPTASIPFIQTNQGGKHPGKK